MHKIYISDRSGLEKQDEDSLDSSCAGGSGRRGGGVVVVAR